MEKFRYSKIDPTETPTSTDDPTINWPEADDGESAGQEIPEGD